MCVYCVNTSYLVGADRPAKCQIKMSFVSTGQAGPVLHICQVVHRTTFLSRQRDVMTSFSFGVCTVQTDFCQLHIFVDICANTVNFHIFCVHTNSSECIDHYGFIWTEVWWM